MNPTIKKTIIFMQLMIMMVSISQSSTETQQHQPMDWDTAERLIRKIANFQIKVHEDANTLKRKYPYLLSFKFIEKVIKLIDQLYKMQITHCDYPPQTILAILEKNYPENMRFLKRTNKCEPYIDYNQHNEPIHTIEAKLVDMIEAIARDHLQFQKQIVPRYLTQEVNQWIQKIKNEIWADPAAIQSQLGEGCLCFRDEIKQFPDIIPYNDKEEFQKAIYDYFPRSPLDPDIVQQLMFIIEKTILQKVLSQYDPQNSHSAVIADLQTKHFSPKTQPKIDFLFRVLTNPWVQTAKSSQVGYRIINTAVRLRQESEIEYMFTHDKAALPAQHQEDLQHLEDRFAEEFTQFHDKFAFALSEIDNGLKSEMSHLTNRTEELKRSIQARLEVDMRELQAKHEQAKKRINDKYKNIREAQITDIDKAKVILQQRHQDILAQKRQEQDKELADRSAQYRSALQSIQVPFTERPGWYQRSVKVRPEKQMQSPP
ncbi:MAG: hypothetical protein LBJ92_04815 [Holosporales bacterium]|jgi:hypothetical protein|nr:hypothetical protein [Holosporales bacterium]